MSLGVYVTAKTTVCEFKNDLPFYRYLEMPKLEFYILLAVIFISLLPFKWQSTVV